MDSKTIMQYEWSARDSYHLETIDSDRVDVILLREIRSLTSFRALRRWDTTTLGRLGCTHNGDHITRVVECVRDLTSKPWSESTATVLPSCHRRCRVRPPLSSSDQRCLVLQKKPSRLGTTITDRYSHFSPPYLLLYSTLDAVDMLSGGCWEAPSRSRGGAGKP